MSKKNLLNESQVRQFMKLASLTPLTPGFVAGLNEGDSAEELEELRTGRTGALGPKDGTANPGHGRGQGEAADGSLFEEEELERELDATEDELGAEDHLADEEADELDDLEASDDSRTISVDDFLSALESALETVMGDEVEVTEEPGDELEADVELDDGGEEVDLDVEEEPLQEGAFGHPPSATGAANNHKGSKQHPDHRNTKNSKGGLASQGPGLVKEEDDEDLAEAQGADDREDEHLGAEDGKESGKKQSMKDRRKEMRGARRAKGESGDPVPTQEGVFGGADKAREKRALGKKGSYAPDPDEGEEEWKGSAPGGEKSTRRRRRASDIGGGGGMTIKGVTSEGEGANTDDLVEQITKRVAARILKSALTKK